MRFVVSSNIYLGVESCVHAWWIVVYGLCGGLPYCVVLCGSLWDIGSSMWIVDVAMYPLRCLGTMCNLALGGLWARIYNLVVAMGSLGGCHGFSWWCIGCSGVFVFVWFGCQRCLWLSRSGWKVCGWCPRWISNCPCMITFLWLFLFLGILC
jgi:hypothetical protein